MKRFESFVWHGSTPYRHFPEMNSKPSKRGTATTIALFFFSVIFIGAFISARWIDASITGGSTQKGIITSKKPLKCSAGNLTQTCPGNYPRTYEPVSGGSSSNPVCPDYFRLIHEDLRPWKEKGISRDAVERARRTAHFRLVIVKGKAYVEKFRKSIQTRDVFTLWGILQLLRRYPGKLPDLELMFDCDDRPVIVSRDFQGPSVIAPPLFRYCGDESTMDIVFPDWSFWGWAETNIKPWNAILNELKEGNKRSNWMERVPYAYWRGNPHVAPWRGDLLRCNVSDKEDWNARLYIQDWIHESQQGYKQSDLASQCTHRYKIYIEGWAWSVSEKYILACDSVTFIVQPRYYDFFIRNLQPQNHYWPIRDNDKCRSIKFGVDWGNSHTKQAEAIGKATSKFIQEELNMDYVYDFMFHLLNEYAKLLKFKPTIPREAVEICSETMACPAEGIEKKFMMESLVKAPTDTSPCTMPPPYDPQAFQSFLQRKANAIKEVETWELKSRETQNKQQ
ncbi:hypothetical protein HHK36_028919 [Tetracentron sinense]|uniref:Glycosyl transferase CAP10 domain-containing protein n=1 Tax=Tetracentron sinense TaxID=13715 RepID=A0A834YE66_TETSI|nr:hypothetical protein HHK36_028919 [Tetracentron sinense]